MIKLTGKIKIITGIHIGMGKDQIGIGGIDAPVIKDRHGYPIFRVLPERKIRSLLAGGVEIRDQKGTPKESPEIQKAFGMAPRDKEQLQIGAGQVIFRDAFLCEDDKKKFDKENKNKFYEEKMETAIDRSTGTAQGKSLRTIERVIPGVSFDLEIILKNENHLELIQKGLELLKDNYLGGMGTRGYGKVEIKLEDDPIDLKETA